MEYTLLKTYQNKTDFDRMAIAYVWQGKIDRDALLEYMHEETDIFARCNHDFDCCGCWFASYVVHYHHNKDGNTVIVVQFLRNV